MFFSCSCKNCYWIRLWNVRIKKNFPTLRIVWMENSRSTTLLWLDVVIETSFPICFSLLHVLSHLWSLLLMLLMMRRGEWMWFLITNRCIVAIERMIRLTFIITLILRMVKRWGWGGQRKTNIRSEMGWGVRWNTSGLLRLFAHIFIQLIWIIWAWCSSGIVLTRCLITFMTFMNRKCKKL